MTNFEHNGTQIELLPNGKFQTTLHGRKVVGGSLDGLKKQIDNAAKVQFQVFKALRLDGWSGLKELTIVGVKPPRKNAWRASNEFVDANGNQHSYVIVDTPENRAALDAWEKYREETRRIDKERAAALELLWEQVKEIRANDYAPKKPA